MATPTPSKLPHHQEMTPGSFANHLAAFSPLPTSLRSVAPSPAHLSKRSPANAAAFHHHHTGSSHSVGPLSFDSPGATALALSLNIPAFGSITSGNVRGDEDERRRRIETILSVLRTRPGRVGEEGIERLAKRTGLEYLWDGQPGGPRMLSIAGTGVLIDVRLRPLTCRNEAHLADWCVPGQLPESPGDQRGHLVPEDPRSPNGTCAPSCKDLTSRTPTTPGRISHQHQPHAFRDTSRTLGPIR